jgi:hypothetical protein
MCQTCCMNGHDDHGATPAYKMIKTLVAKFSPKDAAANVQTEADKMRKLSEKAANAAKAMSAKADHLERFVKELADTEMDAPLVDMKKPYAYLSLLKKHQADLQMTPEEEFKASLAALGKVPRSSRTTTLVSRFEGASNANTR